MSILWSGLIINILCFAFLVPAAAQNTRRIEILNANTIEFDEKLGPDVRKLIGNVSFEHNRAIMHCDSAYFYSERNMIDAFRNIHIIQGDSLHLYGDFLTYSGESRMARVTGNVVLIDKQTKLTTDALDYDLNLDVGYYTENGTIENSPNILKSKQGYYYSKQDLFHFKEKVHINNPDYNMYSDTMIYNTISRVAYFHGPTEIIGKDNYIYCENGWYDTSADISQFNKNAWLRKDDRILKGDSLYYERFSGIGKAFRNVELLDTANHVILKGHYAWYNEITDNAMLTDSTLMIQVNEGDSLFVHADSLRAWPDSTGEFRDIIAYYKVKIYREDIQGMCDSLFYSTRDSVTRMHGLPVLWSEENQLTAESIWMYSRDNGIDRIEMENTAFIISMEDSTMFNQIKGKTMVGYFEDNELTRIEVSGNGQTIFFPPDGDQVIGINKAESSDIVIFLANRKIDEILFLVKPEATLYPLFELTGQDLFLRDFVWHDEHRPRQKSDIFIWTRESSQ